MTDYKGTWQELLTSPEGNAPIVPFEVTFVRHDGSHLPVILTSNILDLDKRRYVVVVLTDNRVHKEFEKARQKALDEAQSLVQARSNFLANMSHEIRTPLSGILGYSQIGLRPRTLKNEEKTRNCFEKISDCSHHLLQVINDVLDFSKIDSYKGGISIEVHLQSGNMTLRIADTGIGIDPADTDRLFHPFEQVDNSSTRRHGGTGLGLAITSRLVSLMGGTLDMSSKIGEGSTFTITMPAPDAEMPDTNESTSDCLSRLKGLNLFVAEDDPITQNLIAEMFDDVEINTQIFSNGLALVERLEEIDAEGCDLVLMDIQMPVMNGPMQRDV